METASYLEKDMSYFDGVRMDIVNRLPRNMSRVMEVGCGSGRTLSFLKSQWGCEWVCGVELVEEAIGRASENLDLVVIGDIEHIDLQIEEGSLDAIICPDVLEHLVDPWSMVERLKSLLKPGGVMVISVPNVRHFKVLVPLVFSGKWNYMEEGILDKTHLRFFVKETALELLKGAGFEVTNVSSNGTEKGSKAGLLNLLSFGLFKSFFEFQYIVTGKKS